MPATSSHRRAARFSPGNLVRARGREWVVLSGSTADVLVLRPISGSEEDVTCIHLDLETVEDAVFPPPDSASQTSQEGALLLSDALQLSLRRGAGPFRSFGQIAVEPRAYQLVPLLMALKLDPVRLLIADDVGVGKTIEAGLVVREFLDRGEIDRFTVLCPPHLVEQWTHELREHFHIEAAGVTATSAARLERALPLGTSIFEAHPATVVSLDYIKSDRRRDEFLRACPEFVIVDEAHTCTSGERGRHRRYELLAGLAERSDRHLVLLTATPHSGDEDAFSRLLGLLHPDFARLREVSENERTRLRERLALHFVQRRRPDIAEWQEGRLFAERETAELTYRLSGAWERFFEDVLDYCADIVQAAGDDVRRQRLNFWGTLALMRCAGSSPAAAVQALRTRAGLADGEEEESLADQLFDGTADFLPENDLEPAVSLSDPKLESLIQQASKLAGQAGDPKLQVVSAHVRKLVREGFSPVVFCRYIATAHYLGRHLKSILPDATVEVVTGDLVPEERRERVESLADAAPRVLVATDCLSEGINLQEFFDAVVHYDLSWNPTRHEQREGRVDRFGQKSPVVRTTLVYGEDNPVDGAVLEVILRKAESIRRELGVPVPVPDDGHALSQALLTAVLLRRRKTSRRQGAFDFMETREAGEFEVRWQDARERLKRSQTIFAQRRLRPADVLPEWNKAIAAHGGIEDVRRFVMRTLERANAAPEALRRGGFCLRLSSLPSGLHERLEAAGFPENLHFDFATPPAAGCRRLQRSHPLVMHTAELFLERTLDAMDAAGANRHDPIRLGRTGAWSTGAVSARTLVLLLRLRHRLSSGRSSGTIERLVEESALVVLADAGVQADTETARALLSAPVAADLPAHVRERMVQWGLRQIAARQQELDAFAETRAQTLLEDHRRVREAAGATGRYQVRAVTPVDVIGCFVLVPKTE